MIEEPDKREEEPTPDPSESAVPEETTPAEPEAPTAAPQEEAGGLDEESAPPADDAPGGEAALPSAEEAPAEETPKPASTATRRRDAVGQVRVRAQAKYVRSSARKARLVCDLIRGKSVEDARAILATTSRSVAKDWSKVLESAVANAENNHDLDGDELRIAAVHADEGPTLKRFRPRAMGRATRIRKRTSHLTIQLTPKES